MKIRSVGILATSLVLFSGVVQANWVCNVSNEKEQQFTYSAPLENDAEKMAVAICQANGIKKNSCDADCFDTGVNQSRWHCSIANQKRESWSFTMLSKDKAVSLAKAACKTHNIKAEDCKPNCSIE